MKKVCEEKYLKIPVEDLQLLEICVFELITANKLIKSKDSVIFPPMSWNVMREVTKDQITYYGKKLALVFIFLVQG